MQHQSEEKNSESMIIPSAADFVGQGILLSNETWEHVFDASPGYIAFISPDYKIQKINKALAGYLGGMPDQFVGKNCYETIHSSSTPALDCPLIKLSGSGTVQTSVVEDGNFGRSVVKAIPMYTKEGSFAGCLHMLEPIGNGRESSVPAQEKERTVNALVNAMPDPALLCDQSGNIMYASGDFLELTGLGDSQSLTGSNYISFFAHDDIDRALLGFNALTYGAQEKLSGQFMIRKAGRESVRCEVSMSLVKQNSINVSGILMTFRDVSGHIALQDSANKNHIRLSRFNKTFLGFTTEASMNINRLVSLLGEMMGASACSFNKFSDNNSVPFASWQSPFLSDFAADMVSGIALEQFNNQPDDFILVTKPQLAPYYQQNPVLIDRYGIRTILAITVKTGNTILGQIVLVFTFNYQLKSDDREFCSMLSSAMALESSRVGLSIKSEVNDVNYRELFDFFTDSIYILAPDGVFIDVNTGATKMYGFTRDEMIGQSVEMLSAPGKNDIESAYQSIIKAFNGEAQEFEWWGIRKNGDVFPKDVVLNRGKYFGRDVVIAIGRDISERKQAEEKLLGYNMELREINQSKDKFFSILAHDLKNPFGGLLGFIDLLYEDIDELSTDQVKEYLQNIRTASYHTYSLLENLLEWSRIQTGKVQFRPSKFDLKEEIESVVQVLDANAIRKNIKLINQVPAGIEAEADRNMIHSVIQNLATNAIKFSNTNSSVTIRGKFALPPEKSGTEEVVSPARKWYEISVTDTGIGIPEDIMPKLFKLDGQFSMTGTANEPGTGLGLILCKEMVEKNGGRIRVDSVPGNGSTFSFTLPLSN